MTLWKSRKVPVIVCSGSCQTVQRLLLNCPKMQHRTYESVPSSDLEPDTKAVALEGGTVSQGAKVAQQNRVLVLIQLLATCGLWLGCSSGIIIVNRIIIKDLGFAYPMAVSAIGQGTSFLVAWFICDVLKSVPAANSVDTRFFLTHIAPIGAAQGVAIWLSNLLYLYLTVAFIEMARALLPLITLLALWVAQVETPTNEHIKAVSLTGVGCAISAYGEVHLSTIGLLALAANFAIEATRMVIMQLLMQGKEIHPWQGLKLMALPATGTLLVMMLILEYPTMAAQRADLVILNNIPYFIAAATLGLAVNFLSNLIIKLSSATTVKLLAAVRGPLVVLSGMLLFAEMVTPLQFGGYSLALAGFVWYNIAKARTPAANPKSPSKP